LGSVPERLPNRRGFDEWYGIPRTTDEAFWPNSPQAAAAGAPAMHIVGAQGRRRSRPHGFLTFPFSRRMRDVEPTTSACMTTLSCNFTAILEFASVNCC